MDYKSTINICQFKNIRLPRSSYVYVLNVSIKFHRRFLFNDDTFLVTIVFIIYWNLDCVLSSDILRTKLLSDVTL